MVDLDPEDIIKNEINGKGIHIGFSIDIRTVEKFFKKLFGKKEENTDDGTDTDTSTGK